MQIVVNMACGLANRMFQYSYYLYLNSLGYNVYVDYYTNGKLAHEDVMWSGIFPHAYIRQAPKTLVLKLGGGNNLISRIRRRFFHFTTNVYQMPTAFDVLLPHSKKDEYLMGVFQNAQMVDKIKNEIHESFTFSRLVDEHNLILENEMKASQSVAIHVRKGADYSSSHYNRYFKNTCPIEYYNNAVAYIKKHIDNPRFYVFTDNPSWVKEYFIGFDYILVEGNPIYGWGNHFDMQLMSCCKHNIISNSTYSWWGAFLNGNQNKIVILPKQWFNPESCKESTSERLMCKNWLAF